VQKESDNFKSCHIRGDKEITWLINNLCLHGNQPHKCKYYSDPVDMTIKTLPLYRQKEQYVRRSQL
jgi:hypothetical protein